MIVAICVIPRAYPAAIRNALEVVVPVDGVGEWREAEFHLMDRKMEAGRAAARALMEQTGGVFTADLP